jgi:hypothetical protein
MAISTVQALPKSQPDVSKLNTFTGYVVTVTKHLGARNTVGTSVVASKSMSKEQILGLMESLPSNPQYGPGFYHFNVTDAGGTGEDTWFVKLGQDVPQQQQEFTMAGPNGVAPGNFPGNVQALGEGVIHLGHNFFYNEAMGTLTTPWRTIVSWKQGDPMPQPPTSPTAASPFVPPPSQWGQQPGGQWGGYPVQDDSATVRELKAQIAEDRRTRELEKIREDSRRQTEETNARIAQNQAQVTALIEKLVTAISAKPSGESPELLAIKQQNETLQRQLENDRRDAAAREAAATTREEMRSMKADTERLITTLTANKSDPMLTMVMTVMQQSNASAMEAVKAIQASTGNANTSAERQVQSLVEQLRSTIISPMQMMEMMRSSRGDGAEMSKMVLETTKEMNSLQRNVFEQLLDASSQGGQPPWLQAVQAALEKVGPIGEALMQQRAQSAQQPRVVVQRVPVYTPPPNINASQLAGAPGVAPPPGPTVAEFRPGKEPGSKLPPAIITPTELPRANMPEPIVVPQDPPRAAAPITPIADAKKTRGKKKPPSGPMTIAQIREMDPDELAAGIAPIPDDVFFGPTLWPAIISLRDQVAAGLPPEGLAEMLLSRRTQLTSIVPLPGAVELFLAEQISVLVERIVPDVDEEYHEKVVDVIEAHLETEASGSSG